MPSDAPNCAWRTIPTTVLKYHFGLLYWIILFVVHVEKCRKRNVPDMIVDVVSSIREKVCAGSGIKGGDGVALQ